MAGLYAPLPTLRRRPRERLRTDRGRHGLLTLHRSGLSPHTPCRSPGALTHVTARRIAQPPYGDLCHEAPTQPVTRPSCSPATGPIDNFPGRILLYNGSRLRGARPTADIAPTCVIGT